VELRLGTYRLAFRRSVPSRSHLEIWLCGLGALPILCTLAAYFVLFVIDRDRLQSEEFVPRQHELAIIERKSGSPIPSDTDVSIDPLQIEFNQSERGDE
jgi:hypothetical protein